MESVKQIGALCLRRTEGGEFEVLLVTSRESGRWVIPKGWPMRRITDHNAAEREAFEEAGVQGEISRKAYGKFQYFKRTPFAFRLIAVKVFVLWVKKEKKLWPEMNQRQRRWFSLEEAIDVVVEPQLSSLLGGLVDNPPSSR